jgi:glucose/arabinose dehydrogenase
MFRSIAILIAVLLLAAACSDNGTAETTTFMADTSTTNPSSTTEVPATTGAPTTTTGPATTSTTAAALPLSDIDLTLVEVASGFTQPVFVDSPAGDDRLFVVDQAGTVEVLNDGERATFLDISSKVHFEREQGLLGLAFHPDFAQNGRFFVDYTDTGGTTIIEEYLVSGTDPDVADPEPARVVLTVEQPAANHNGGMLAFGPDGYLYIALGDGGGAGDRYGNGQNTETLLGTILRFDVDDDPYSIPADNVFANGEGAPEIWAYGLRNPWRFSFDSDLIYIADVGQGLWEEIDVADISSTGLNFGWPLMEGNHCFAVDNCDPSGLELPVLEYGHNNGDCSVTGGYVYRGAAIPELHGAYFYGDYCSGRLASFRFGDGGIVEERDWTSTLGAVPWLTSFGTDADGELYLMSTDGRVLRIEPA